MKLYCKKLNSSHGASILMGLLVVLVVTMVSVVILSAATANSGRIRRNQAEEQAYLTVSSAARLMRDTIVNGSEYVYALECWTFTEDKYGNEIKVTIDPAAINNLKNGKPFAELINSITQQANGSEAKKSFTITAGENIEPVKVDVTMYASTSTNPKAGRYCFKAVFSIDTEDTAKANSYVTLNCTTEEKADEMINGYHARTIRWNTGELTKGAQ